MNPAREAAATGDEQTDARPGDASSRRARGAYRNFLRPRRPSEIFAAERGRPDPSASADDLGAGLHRFRAARGKE